MHVIINNKMTAICEVQLSHITMSKQEYVLVAKFLEINDDYSVIVLDKNGQKWHVLQNGKATKA